MWAWFVKGPPALVDGVPRRLEALEKFPPNSQLPMFFNAYAAQATWTYTQKTGIQCLNRVKGLRSNEERRQVVRDSWDLADVHVAHALLATWIGKLCVRMCGRVCT